MLDIYFQRNSDFPYISGTLQDSYVRFLAGIFFHTKHILSLTQFKKIERRKENTPVPTGRTRFLLRKDRNIRIRTNFLKST